MTGQKWTASECDVVKFLVCWRTASEVAERFAVSHPTAHRWLVTLLDRGWVHREVLSPETCLGRPEHHYISTVKLVARSPEVYSSAALQQYLQENP